MMKELKNILLQANAYHNKGISCVMATIVEIEGSGYRREGTRMLISQNGEFTGAISGGCVEKEVWLQSAIVFKTNKAKLMTYDGRYRLGCEGTLYILIEPVEVKSSLLNSFLEFYKSYKTLQISCYYTKTEKQSLGAGSILHLNDENYKLKDSEPQGEIQGLSKFTQYIQPAKVLYIFGSEHDSVALSSIASIAGWDVTIVAHPLNEKDRTFFPDAERIIHILPEETGTLSFHCQTACILMSHSFSRDLAYLMELSKIDIPYIGLLGPHKRKAQLLDKLIELQPEVSEKFLDNIYGPVGLDIGAETPQEIAIAILAELQSVFSKTEVDHLRNKSGHIHVRS